METMNYKEVADLLHINTGTLRNWVSQGKFIRPLKRPGVKGRVLFLREEVEAWIEKRAQRKLDTKAGCIELDHDKNLAFTVTLFNNNDPSRRRVLALVRELQSSAAMGSDDSFWRDLSVAELRAIAKAFFDYADDKELKDSQR